jgi:histidinol-phosphatase
MLDDLTLAHTLADEADAITLARFGASDLRVETKPDLTPVSDADKAVEHALRTTLADVRPNDAVAGEEGGVVDAGVNGRRWVIDPIDGTKNFVRGVPVWATLIALMDGSITDAPDDDPALTAHGLVTTAVVSAPSLGRRWWAARGRGAWTGPSGIAARGSGSNHVTAGTPPVGRRITVSGVADLNDASLSFSSENQWGDRLDAFRKLREACWRTRAYGDFWSHVLVADGVVDIAVEPALSLWDFAALVPIVAEAGGRITALDGSPCASSGLTTNGPLHEQVVSALTA